MKTLLSLFTAVLFLLPTEAFAETVDIAFPVLGGASYSNDWGAPRSGGRTHEGNDLIAAKHTPLVAVTDGTVQQVAYPEPSYGYAVFLKGDDGYTYRYLHMNNDTPGTDDGNGGGMNAYAPYMERGNRVTKGQIVGWVGDSGNAESTTSHLHFEVRRPDGTAINPYESLIQAPVLTSVEPAPQQDGEILPFAQVPVNTSLAVCKDTREGNEAEFLVVGAGEGGGPQVRVYKMPNMNLVSSFFAYGEDFRGGVDVTCGDTDANGRDEIITAPGPGGTPHIRILTLAGKFRNDFHAYKKSYRGGVNIAAADLNGNGKSAIIVAPKGDHNPNVQVYAARGKKVRGFRAFAKSWQGGLDVAALPATETNKGRIVVGANEGGGAQVRIFDKKGNWQKNVWPYGEDFQGGVRVTAAVQQDGTSHHILTAPATEGSGSFRLYNGRGKALTYEQEFEPWWIGGYDVALSENFMWIGTRTTDRRASVRSISLGSQNNNRSRDNDSDTNDWDQWRDYWRRNQ